jgi:serine/threonine-protein kinase
VEGGQAVGSVFAGKYRLERVLGSGGMGVVYEATHLGIDRRVAIKVLVDGDRASERRRRRFRREALSAGRLRSPHVVRIVDVDETPQGRPYIVMEHLEGHDLAVELRRRGRLPVSEAVDWVLQAASAIAEAHDSGVVHRDIKPANLFLARDGRSISLKVLDFGIAKMNTEPGDEPLTATSGRMGTPLYMSPEQIRGARTAGPRSDIWSLGVVLFELLAGQPPFGGDTPFAVTLAITTEAAPSLTSQRPDVPPALEAALQTALAKDPNERWPSAREFAEALTPFGRFRAHARAPAARRSVPAGVALWLVACAVAVAPPSVGRVASSERPALLPAAGDAPARAAPATLATSVPEARAVAAPSATFAALPSLPPHRVQSQRPAGEVASVPAPDVPPQRNPRRL